MRIFSMNVGGWVYTIGLSLILTFLLLTSLQIEAAENPVIGFSELTEQRGIGGDHRKLNKYAWSSTTFSKDNKIYIGTFNFDLYVGALALSNIQTSIEESLLPPDGPGPDMAKIDAFRRLWSGTPVTVSRGGEIWRYDDPGWTQVLKLDSEHVGFREMIEFNGYLYGGTANGPNGPDNGAPYGFETVTYVAGRDGSKLYRSASGDRNSWEEVEGGPSLNITNSSIRTMQVINNRLWVGTENVITGPEVWSFDGVTWTQEHLFDPQTQRTNIPGLSVGEIAEFKGSIFLGLWGENILQLLGPGGLLMDVTPAVPNMEDNEGVMQLFEFKGMFYLGTVNYGSEMLGGENVNNGFTFLRTSDPTDPESWEEITRDGFETEHPGLGTSKNEYAWSTQVINGRLFMGTFNTGGGPGQTDTATIFTPLIMEPSPFLLGASSFENTMGRAQIWFTEDGMNWQNIEYNGFNSPYTYGARTMTTWNDRLIIGTGANMFVPGWLTEPSLYHSNPDDIGAQVFATNPIPPEPPSPNNLIPIFMLLLNE